MTAAKHATVRRLIPYLLALFFALWSLRGIEYGNVVDTDAARHAMNGAFLRDLVASGQLSNPIEYGKFYYGRLPALSMPYHPPLFPAIESAFFALFGVNLIAARLVIALSVGISVFLLYRLIVYTHGSSALAVFAVSTFCMWKFSQNVGSDVMLEYPAMAFMAAALYCIRDLDTSYQLRDGLLFAFFAGAAVWVKQHAILLGLVPFLYIAISRRWRLLLDKTLWISSAVFGCFVLGLLALAHVLHGAGGTEQVPPVREFLELLTNNAGFYYRTLVRAFGVLGAIFVIAAFVLSLFDVWGERRMPGRHLYTAWAAAAWGLLLWLGAYDERYMFFLLPPVLVIAYELLARLSTVLVAPSRKWYAPGVVAGLFFVLGLMAPVQYLRGPAQAAEMLVDGSPRRILYCGSTDGNFIFAARTRDPKLRTVVISGDKLPQSVLSPSQFPQFAHRYGIDYIVLERSAASPSYEGIANTDSKALVWKQDLPLSSSQRRWAGGVLSIYRFANPSTRPEETVSLMLPGFVPKTTAEF